MKPNSRLSLALHTLGHMADDEDRMRTSADIAEHAGTNPVVVRRVLGRLREAGLLVSEKGHAGGWRLARTPDRITLADVYIALDESIIASEGADYASSCAVESALHRRVAAVMDEAEQGLIRRLSETTIAQIHGK
ncbi:MAG: Rrf2 family transcriptional regulator [Pseudomonadota bacterium]